MATIKRPQQLLYHIRPLHATLTLFTVSGAVDGQGAREGGSAMPANDLSDTLRALSEQSATLRAASGNAGAPFSSPADIFSDPMFAGYAPHHGLSATEDARCCV